MKREEVGRGGGGGWLKGTSRKPTKMGKEAKKRGRRGEERQGWEGERKGGKKRGGRHGCGGDGMGRDWGWGGGK